MNRHYLSLCVVILIFLVLRYLVAGHISFPNPPLSRPSVFQPQDSESLLARGKRLWLITADLYSLELLSGISDSLAHEIIKSKRDVSAHAVWKVKKAPDNPLEYVHGIGEKRAKKFSRYLSVFREGNSESTKTYDEVLPLWNEPPLSESSPHQGATQKSKTIPGKAKKQQKTKKSSHPKKVAK